MNILEQIKLKNDELDDLTNKYCKKLSNEVSFSIRGDKIYIFKINYGSISLDYTETKELYNFLQIILKEKINE